MRRFFLDAAALLVFGSGCLTAGYFVGECYGEHLAQQNFAWSEGCKVGQRLVWRNLSLAPADYANDPRTENFRRFVSQSQAAGATR
jgi:hypothetical protein